jgi:hypothetical protein
LRDADTRLSKREAFNALSVEVNFAMLLASEALQEFGKRALCAMAAVHKR